MLIGLPIFSISLLLVLLTWIYRHSQIKPFSDPLFYESAPAERTQYKNIPPIIWTYWHTQKLPAVVERCIAGWQKLNPTYSIHILHPGNLPDYLSNIPSGLDKLGIPKQTDWIRLALLNKYGGHWIDVSIILTQPLTWVEQIQARTKVELIGFYLDGYTVQPNFPVLDSWFLAAPKGSSFVEKWFNAFTQVIESSTSSYLESLKDEGRFDSVVQAIGDPYYHTIHVVAQDIIRKGFATGHTYHLYLLRAEDIAYALHVQSGWKRRPLFVRLLFSRLNEVPRMIKLRGGERRKLETYLRYNLFRKGSLVERFLNQTPS